MANKKISALTAITSLDTGDLFAVVDVTVPETKKITRENLALDLQTLMPVLPIVNAGGTVDAITADYTPNITLSDRRLCAFIATGANTSTTPTFAPDGLTARTIVKMGGQALAAGDIPGAEAVCILQYDLTNTRWELLNPTVFVSDAAYGAGWNGVTTIAPSKNAVYDSLMAKTGANLAIGSDADGDMYYRAASVLARLAKGAIGYTLKMNAAGTAPNWEAEAKGHPFNLQIAVNATVNKIDVFAKSSGTYPDASNPIAILIPDVSGNVVRTRAAAYLSGTGSFTLSDGVNYWAGLVSIGDSTTQFDITNTAGSTYRYTYDTTGTNPYINILYPRVGDIAVIAAQNFAAGNNGTYAITAVALNYFEVTNAGGAVESNKTIGTGSIKISPAKSTSGAVNWAYVYAIWDGTGIVWGLAGHPYHTNVPVTTSVEDNDYMLLEGSSTYTRSNSHYCKCIGRVPYTYYTGDAPDHTFLATAASHPQIGYIGEAKSGIVQRIKWSTTVTDTNTTAIPNDTTIPQISEGEVACQLSITPRRAGSIIKVEVSGLIGFGTTPPVTVALFKDDAANSVAASNNRYSSAYGGARLWLFYETKNNALTAIKFMVRYGVPSGGYAYMNLNDSAAATYGTALPPFTVQITEYDVDI
jgi:hypothetical protein